MGCHIKRCIVYSICVSLLVSISLVYNSLRQGDVDQTSHQRLIRSAQGLNVIQSDAFHKDVKPSPSEANLTSTGPKPVAFHDVRNITKKIKQLWPLGPETVYDRIVDQMDDSFTPRKGIFKRILTYYGFEKMPDGDKLFKDNNCPVQQCEITKSKGDLDKVDAVLTHGSPNPPTRSKNRNQIWIMYLLECPFHTNNFHTYHDLINWTATYRRDSTIVTPYEKFVHFTNFTKLPDKPPKNYAEGKNKTIAWFVSHCKALNGRQRYVEELSKYIQVDIYGQCGKYSCPRSLKNHCFEMLSRDYKFYLSFENSNCRDYITEKFFQNALWNDIVPIVMGAHPDDYKALSPPHSYIHVDDYDSPKALAEYLHKLMSNDTLYNQYYRWKGTGEFINTKFWCRLCRMLHETEHHWTWYENLDDWWRGPGVCLRPAGRNQSWASWRGYLGYEKHFLKTKGRVISQDIST